MDNPQYMHIHIIKVLGPSLHDVALHELRLEYQSGFGTILIGGRLTQSQVKSKSIWKFDYSQWTKLDMELEEARNYFVSFPVSKNFISC